MSPRGAGTERAWIEVDLDALSRNAERMARDVAPARLLPMVKADGYGLGATPVADALRRVDPWGFGVASTAEGVELREAGIERPIVVFSACAPIDLDGLLSARLEPAAGSLAALSTYAEAGVRNGTPVDVHLEIDTGMGRMGLPAGSPDVWLPPLQEVLDGGGLRLRSTFTHFHSAEDAGETRAQWERYQAVLSRLRAAGANPGLCHAANGAAGLAHAETRADLVRPGLFLFGGGGCVGDGLAEPEPVAHVRARVLEVRDLEAGATVSYGATFVASGPMRAATLGIGYGDGLPHRASNRGAVLVSDRRAPVLGRVCMDMTIVDVTGRDDVVPGTVATILGRDDEQEITLSEMADTCGTIEYEILTGLGRRLPRLRPTPTQYDGGSECDAAGASGDA